MTYLPVDLASNFVRMLFYSVLLLLSVFIYSNCHAFMYKCYAFTYRCIYAFMYAMNLGCSEEKKTVRGKEPNRKIRFPIGIIIVTCSSYATRVTCISYATRVCYASCTGDWLGKRVNLSVGSNQCRPIACFTRLMISSGDVGTI